MKSINKKINIKNKTKRKNKNYYNMEKSILNHIDDHYRLAVANFSRNPYQGDVDISPQNLREHYLCYFDYIFDWGSDSNGNYCNEYLNKLNGKKIFKILNQLKMEPYSHSQKLVYSPVSKIKKCPVIIGLSARILYDRLASLNKNELNTVIKNYCLHKMHFKSPLAIKIQNKFIKTPPLGYNREKLKIAFGRYFPKSIFNPYWKTPGLDTYLLLSN